MSGGAEWLREIQPLSESLGELSAKAPQLSCTGMRTKAVGHCHSFWTWMAPPLLSVLRYWGMWFSCKNDCSHHDT